MAEYREARPSTDAENAPLLRDPDEDGVQNGGVPPKKSFSEQLAAISQEPLTLLTKILLVVTLVLLLLTSIFVGLFAGAEHKLRNVKKGHDGEGGGEATATVTQTTTVHQTQTIPAGPLPTKAPENNLCTKAECVQLAASILGGLDSTQDPCENFYLYANGGWLQKNEIPPGRGSFAVFDKLAQENKRIIRGILEPESHGTTAFKGEASLIDYDQLTLKKLRGLYKSCLDEEHLNERGAEPLLDITRVVKQLFRGESLDISSEGNQRPLSASDQAKNDDRKNNGLTAAIAYLHSRGIGALFSFDIDGDAGVDPNAMSLWFSQPGLGLPSKEYYGEEEIVGLYQQTIEDLLYILDEVEDEDESHWPDGEDGESNSWPPWPWPPWGDDDDKGKGGKKKRDARAREAAKTVVEFEKRVADASLDLEDLYGDPFGTYNPTPFHTFANALPQIHIPTYLSTFAPRNFPTQVIVTSPAFVASLSSILSNTTEDALEAYLVSRAALALAPYLGYETSAWQAHRALTEKLQGIKKGQVPDRREWCIQRVEESMGFAAGRFFVQETFGGESRKKGTKVIEDIISAFKESLKNLSWMDEESATAAAEKADAIRVKVGYPLSPNTDSAESIARYYSLVKVNETKFFENIVSASVSDEIKKWFTLGKRRNLESWEMYPSMVNAYFNPPANEIVFPAGILRPPFFSQDWPSYLQYGAFGHVAAHELTHAFDSSGRLYNQHGKLEEWWTNKTSEGFNKRQKCIADQYSKYTVDDGKGGKVHVNGNLTSGENIGDTGLIQAYRAWRGQYHTSLVAGKEYLLPGLNYTQEQLFFIANAQIWAQTIKPEAAVQRVRTDPHSPNQYRVEGTVSNMPEFAAAFNCPAGSKLNPPPEKRCILW